MNAVLQPKNPNNLELNKGDQFIIALDVSGSMGTTDTPSGLTRYKHVLEQLSVFMAEAGKWDPDGVSFYTFGERVTAYPNLAAGEYVNKLPKGPTEGTTCTDMVIKAAYAEHKKAGSEQTFFMIFTDGEPADHQAVKRAIIDITKDVKDEKEFRIAFLTVGVRSSTLEAFLTNLDDTLTSDGAKYDIVDVKRLEDVDFMAAVSGALND